MIRSLRLGVFLVACLALAGQLAAQEPTAEPGLVAVGGVEIRLSPPEAPLERVDESDNKFQDALKAFWSGEESSVLGVYAEAAAWRQFAKALGQSGAPTPGLDLYALASTPAVLTKANYNQGDFLVFKKAVVQVNQSAQIIADLPRALTFRTIVNPGAGGDQGRFRILTSVILVQGKVVYLTVFDNDRNKYKDQMPALALAWRDACLEANQP